MTCVPPTTQSQLQGSSLCFCVKCQGASAREKGTMAEDFEWAQPHPELHKVCTLFGRLELRAPLAWRYRPLPSLLQQGPQCGLVALAMLSGAPVDAIQAHAHAQGYTSQGELFSCDHMLELAQRFLRPPATCRLYSGRLDDAPIKRFLLQGGCLLVPYDTAKDNSPGLQGGRKAHWGVVSGAINTGRALFVVARHGKARNVGIWTLTELADSNQQLRASAPECAHLRLPPGGIDGPSGLNGRSVLVQLGDS
ncbi:hypothetical protein HUJ05_011133 [Dendroctonus ponderosae]|nr:hypothetical protein HUJ05_011133 [Dendroctonus ponderosae]